MKSNIVDCPLDVDYFIVVITGAVVVNLMIQVIKLMRIAPQKQSIAKEKSMSSQWHLNMMSLPNNTLNPISGFDESDFN